MLEDRIKAGAETMGIPLSEVSLRCFRRFYELLEEKNRVMDLTAVKGEEEIVRSHFLDSLMLARLIDQGATVADVGSGAGFPGVPLAIARPDLQVTLLESMQKRCAYLKEVAALEEMPPLFVVEKRAEEAAELRERFDAVTARAVARLNLLCELCLPLVKVGGAFWAMKGPGAKEELSEAKKGIALLGGGEPEILEYEIPGSDRSRCVVLIPKVAPTPAKYPRRYAKIVKNPLGSS